MAVAVPESTRGGTGWGHGRVWPSGAVAVTTMACRGRGQVDEGRDGRCRGVGHRAMPWPTTMAGRGREDDGRLWR